MIFKKSDLRNNERPLLRRIQRQIDLENENKDIEYSKLLSSKYVKPMGIFKGFILEEESETLSVPIKKSTRLGLYKQRGGR